MFGPVPMRTITLTRIAVALTICVGFSITRADEFVAELPAGVKPVWLVSESMSENTPTRERLCINGLWRWQPARDENATQVPAGGWGYFKVPGPWPGITDHMQKDCQTVFRHPSWKETSFGDVTAAWYQREITVPTDWVGQRVLFKAEYLNSLAVVFVDGKKAGELRFPGGTLDLTTVCKPNNKYILSIYVLALPLKDVMVSYVDAANSHRGCGKVARRGLVGDVFLFSEPVGPRLRDDARVETSVRRGEIVCSTSAENLAPKQSYSVKARVLQNNRVVKEFVSDRFTRESHADGRINFKTVWKPERLWNLQTPGNQFGLRLALVDGDGAEVDIGHDRAFAFREFWIDGRDFYLNGSRIYLSGTTIDNAQIDAEHATYARARETLERLKGFGVNFVYAHNYDCEPGSHLSFNEILRAADDVGMLVALTQPHFGHYDWTERDADVANGYARHAEFYAGVAGNHPSVVFYAMSHNATDYNGDMNRHMTNRIMELRQTWPQSNAKLALRAAAIVNQIDPVRILYRPAFRNLRLTPPKNDHFDFARVRERSNSWWRKGERLFGSAEVPWEFYFDEWNAETLRKRGFGLNGWEMGEVCIIGAQQFRSAKDLDRGGSLFGFGFSEMDDRSDWEVRYLDDNLCVIEPQATPVARIGGDASRKRNQLPVDWNALQRPGYSADFSVP